MTALLESACAPFTDRQSAHAGVIRNRRGRAKTAGNMPGPLEAWQPGESYRHIPSRRNDPYASRVVEVYHDSPGDWQKILGSRMWFQFGVYPADATEVTLEEAGRLYLDMQLEIAGYGCQSSVQPERAIDVGCGWGYPLAYLAHRFERCAQLDGINISPRQLEHAQQLISQEGIAGRVNLYQCNAQDMDQIPGCDRLYDLVMFRGSITHFPYSVLERTMDHVRRYIAPGGKLLITDNLYNVPLASYRSPIADGNDRLACGHRKTVEYVRGVLDTAGFQMDDLRVLPNGEDTIRWLTEVRQNIEAHFSGERPGAIEDLYVSCENQIKAIERGLYSVYSIIASPC